MSHELLGIANEQEFYATHYLAAILTRDIKPIVKEWRKAASRDGDFVSPVKRLRKLQRRFFQRDRDLVEETNPGERVRLHHAQAASLLGALGYRSRPLHREVLQRELPLLIEATRADGAPLLWVLPATGPHTAQDDTPPDLLRRRLLPAQHGIVPDADPDATTDEATVEELVTAAFGAPEPPRFLLVLGEREWVLADRGKWAEQRLLRFDWSILLDRRDKDALSVAAALLHRDSLAPDTGPPRIDTFDDASHKHAFGVSEDLKYALRRSIEAIGNEALWWRRHKQHKGVFDGEIDGAELGIECLRFMYRILFLLYVEARPELGYAPMGAEVRNDN